jgi:hypothetical protein
MAYEGRITKFLGQGLAAARPTNPNLHPDAIGFYWSTDAAAGSEISVWAEGAWSTLSTGSVTGYTDENARDAIAAMLAAGTHQSLTVTNNDAGDSMNLSLTPSVQAVTSAATVTPTFANDQVNITAQAAALALANPTGTAVPAWGLVIRIKDNGTARAISYGTQYRSIGVGTLPTTTVAGKTLYLGMIYNSTDTKWDVVAVAQEA